jgi:8-hydroxy-5-deazaflavin:NADPH oxidoreductase
MTRVGVLGSGIVGQTLAKGLQRHGYDVRIGTRDAARIAAVAPGTGIPAALPSDAAAWAEMIVLAVPGHAAEEALTAAGAEHLRGKTIIDVTNPLAPAAPEDGVLRVFTGPNDSLMERLQTAFPDAHFVKAFNSIGNAFMVNPTFPGGPPTMFYCGNDAGAKKVVARVIEQFGWDGCDMGTAKAARAIEPLCVLWCIPGLRGGSWQHAFKLLRL